MRKTKFKLILFTMIISLIGVGFAAWSINVPTDETSESGDFIADDVILVEALSDPVFDTELRYNSKGFFTQHQYDYNKQDITSTTYNKITYSINVNLPLCKEKLVAANSFQLRIRLKDNSSYTNIVDIYNLINVTVAINNVDEYTVAKDIDSTTKEMIVNVKIPLDKVGTSVSTVSITYDFSKVSGDSEVVKNFFAKLAKIENDRAFIVSTSLYAIYIDEAE